MIIHSHGLPSAFRANEALAPQHMQINAYITSRDTGRHNVPISRIVQIFAEDILPSQCIDYASRCIVSGMAADITNQTIYAPLDPTQLLPTPATAHSSHLLFRGYRTGAMESFLRPPILRIPGAASVELVDASGRRIHRECAIRPPQKATKKKQAAVPDDGSAFGLVINSTFKFETEDSD